MKKFTTRANIVSNFEVFENNFSVLWNFQLFGVTFAPLHLLVVWHHFLPEGSLDRNAFCLQLFTKRSFASVSLLSQICNGLCWRCWKVGCQNRKWWRRPIRTRVQVWTSGRWNWTNRGGWSDWRIVQHTWDERPDFSIFVCVQNCIWVSFRVSVIDAHISTNSCLTQMTFPYIIATNLGNDDLWHPEYVSPVSILIWSL